MTKLELVKERLSRVFEERLEKARFETEYGTCLTFHLTPEEYIAELTSFVVDQLAEIKSSVLTPIRCSECGGRGHKLVKDDEHSFPQCVQCDTCKGYGFRVVML